LSRVLSAQEKYEEALAVLDVKLDLAAHKSSWDEARGDIYFAMERPDDAREAYQLAVQSVSPDRAKPYLEMKLEDLTYAKVVVPDEAPEEAETTSSADGEQ
jgi:predicted negative regulator of RcsB-dependent stress response